MHQVSSNMGRQTFKEGKWAKETGSMPLRQKSKHPGHQGGRLHVTSQGQVGNSFCTGVVVKKKHK